MTDHPKFKRGDRVRKIKGASWQGRVVGTYETALTPEGYAVESEREPGSVQIYPADALEMFGPMQDESLWYPDRIPGWTEWGGGECPVDPSEQVAVLLRPWRPYRMRYTLTGRADMWDWRHTGGAGDIVAYRVVDDK